jgi:hypothetical protein
MEKSKEFYLDMIVKRIDELKRALLKESKPNMQAHLQHLLKVNRDWLIYVNTGQGEIIMTETKRRYVGNNQY